MHCVINIPRQWVVALSCVSFARLHNISTAPFTVGFQLGWVTEKAIVWLIDDRCGTTMLSFTWSLTFGHLSHWRKVTFRPASSSPEFPSRFWLVRSRAVGSNVCRSPTFSESKTYNDMVSSLSPWAQIHICEFIFVSSTLHPPFLPHLFLQIISTRIRLKTTGTT